MFKATIYKATVYWKPSVADPAHIVWASLPNGCQFAGTRFQRILVRLLGWSLERQWKLNEEILKELTWRPEA